MKKCTKCEKEKPLEAYGRNGKDHKGCPVLRSSCRECERKRDALRGKEETGRVYEGTSLCDFCQEPLNGMVKKFGRGNYIILWHVACSKRYEDILSSL